MFATALDNPVIANASNCASGSKVAGVYVEFHFANQIQPSLTGVVVGPSVYHWAFYRSPNSLLTAVDPSTTGTSNYKQYILKEGMEMLAPSSHAKRFGYVRIPRPYQRLNNNDSLRLSVKNAVNNGTNDNFCGKIIYKEIRG